MTDLVVGVGPAEYLVPPEDLAALSIEGLKAELARALEDTSKAMVRLAWIVRLLEERGEDLSDLKLGLLPYLRKIAYGQVAAEAVVRFMEYPLVLARVTSLPIPDQKRLASGEHIQLAIRREDGSIDHRLADPLRLTRRQVSQVFGQGRIRDQSEQILMIEDAPKEAAPKRRDQIGSIRLDRKRGGLIVGKTFVGAADVLIALTELSHFEDDELSAESQTVPVQLSDRQHQSLKMVAARGKISMQSLMRRALASAGLFGQS